MTLKIENHKIDDNNIFVIAEIGNNHNGSFERAINMVDKAIEAGATCVKFQMRDLEEVYRERSLSKTGEDLGTEYIIDLLSKFELTPEEHEKISIYCAEKGVIYLCTPWDIKSVDTLENMGVPAFKVASADMTNMPLIEKLVKTKKPLILSTGMSNEVEINKTLAFLKQANAAFILLHCNSTYPAPFDDINLRFLLKLKQWHAYVGYSGHERGISVSLAAAALGACVIERHVTLDRQMEGPDHAASLTFPEFKEMITGIKQIKAAMGNAKTRKMSQGEMINRENLGKSLVAKNRLSKGIILKASDITVKSPGQGLSPQYLDQLIGQKLARDIESEGFFFPTDIGAKITRPRNYKFSRTWGIPVRFHDFEKFATLANPELYEFHLSYSDMDLEPHVFLTRQENVDFVVHAPELFDNSHLLDLASPITSYRQHSIAEMQRVIDLTVSLKKYFPKTQNPLIVTNIGGFSMDAPIEREEIPEYYLRFADSLKHLNLKTAELIPQTMAPFPWHFGGQRFQNLFVNIDEITHWCKSLNLRVCFDISHSKLTCNHLGLDFAAFCKKIAPITAHIHLGDATGVNGEGLKLGDGEIDFKMVGHILKNYAPKASFIPEIWQGHKNDGEGFWQALDALDSYF